MSVEATALIEQNKAIKLIAEMVQAQNDLIFKMEERISELEKTKLYQMEIISRSLTSGTIT